MNAITDSRRRQIWTSVGHGPEGASVTTTICELSTIGGYNKVARVALTPNEADRLAAWLQANARHARTVDAAAAQRGRMSA